MKNDMAGAVEVTHIQDFSFAEQFYTFGNYGYGRGTQGELIGDSEAAFKDKESSIFNKSGGKERKAWTLDNKKRKREELAAAGDQVDEGNPWAEVDYEEAEIQLTEEQVIAVCFCCS